MFTDHIDPEVLKAHGRMRLLRKLRNQEAQKYRKAIENMHTQLLAVIRSLDLNDLHKPLDIRGIYKQARQSERRLAEIDAERHDVEAGIVALGEF